MAAVDVDGLSVRYGPHLALDGLDLRIAGGELFVLLGGSGSGKTTLLRTLGGFVAPASGRILIDGKDVTALPPHKRPTNTTFQSYALFPHMTVFDNVAFGLRRQGLRTAALRPRVTELLELVRMAEFAGRRPDALSGGQRQRVALARALAPRPGVLLLDEPLSALDRNLREQTRHELVRVQRETGTTFVLVTHDQDEALTMAHRIGLLHEGRLAQVGTPTEIYERPASRFVAGFMGAANILPGVVRSVGRESVVNLPCFGPVRVAGSAPGSLGMQVHVAVRPERLRLHAEPGAAAEGCNVAAGTLVAQAYRGATLDQTVLLADGTSLLASCALGAAEGPAPAPGAAVWVAWRPGSGVILTR